MPLQLAKPLYNLVMSMNTNPVRYLVSHRQSSKLPLQLAKPLDNLVMSMNTKGSSLTQTELKVAPAAG